LRQAGGATGVAVFGSLIASGFVAGLHIALAVSAALLAMIFAMAPLLSA